MSSNAAAIELIVLLRRIAREEAEQVYRENAARTAGRPKEQLVYVIQGDTGGPVKIGIAFDPVKRLAELQRTSPVPLRIITTFAGGSARERQIHDSLLAARLHGEWFDVEHPHVAESLAECGADAAPITNDNAPTAHQPVSTVGASTEGV